MQLAVVLVLVLALSSAQESPESVTKKPVKRSYVCPPNFIRLSHRCYFFSKEEATWQDAYFQCRDLHSNLAIVKNSNQDKLIRRTLSKRTLAPLERWLGGLYDWEQMTWKWAASGKPLGYQGFSRMEPEDKEKLRWHCIIVDPQLQYKWNTRSCLEQKHFICHTKIKVVTNKGKKKLLRQYNVDKYNKLNEIPVPILPDNSIYNTTINLKGHQPNNLNLNAEFASKPKARKRKNNRRNKKKKVNSDAENNEIGFSYRYQNGTMVLDEPIVMQADQMQRRRRKKSKEPKEPKEPKEKNREHMEKEMSMQWKTYFKDSTLSPLHPKAIVEEFNYVKDA